MADSPAKAAAPPFGVAPVISPTGFGIDGELFANTPGANIGDWLVSSNYPGTAGGVLGANGEPLNPIYTFHFIDPQNGDDSVFGGGIKWPDDPNTWRWTTAKASAKTDINNVLLHIGTDVDGHVWVMVAGDRRSTGGDSYIDFEFLQNSLTRTTNGGFSSAGPNGGRTANDILLSLAFGGGGEVADFFAWQWRSNASGGFSYVNVTASLPTNRVFAALNSNTIAVPFGAFGSSNYPAFAFAEAAVDLTAVLGNFDPCQSFGFKTIMVKTKASQSGAATIEDFVEPIQYNVKIGPSANAGADQVRCTEGSFTAFPLQGSATAGIHPLSSNYWTVVSGIATIDNPGSLVTTAKVSSATATLRLTVMQSDGCSESDEIVLSVAPLPDCLVTGPASACPGASSQFQGPAGMDGYSWTVNGNGSISGPANAQTVTVLSGSNCGSNYTVVLTVTSNNCSKSCSTPVSVIDTEAPSISCPTNVIAAENPRESGSAHVTFASPVATDACDQNPTVTTSPAAGSSFAVGFTTVTGTAVDHCGNSNSCQFTVRVIPYKLYVTNVADAGPGTLRQALLDGNDSPDENLVLFTLPGTAPFSIELLSALPPIDSPIIIDGLSQPGSNSTPVIEVSGPGGSNSFDGLVIRSGHSRIRGLVLNGFVTAIRIETNGGNVIQGNYIGTDFSGTNAAGNSGDGIFISTGENLIGGTTNGSANVIAFNGHNGITVLGGARNGILGNAIFSNGALGLDLGNDGVTANDPDDSDDGPNDGQNHPVLTDVTSIEGITTVYGELTSVPNKPYLLEFYLNDTADGEGQVYIGSKFIFLGETGTESFTVTFPIKAVWTQFITATATGPFNNTSEFSPAEQVRTPPVIDVQPVSTNVAEGGTVVLCAQVSGTPPLYFQWRNNGVNIPGATNACITVPDAQIAQGGGYTVCVANDLGAIASVSAGLLLNLPSIAPGDNFADRVPLLGTSGVAANNNLDATFEVGEPFHAGKPGGKSVWYTWTPTFTGVATFRTLGSTFDSLLAVYSGTALTNLVTVDSDEDRGGFYTSKTFFNAFKDVPYHIAIDGFGGASGNFIFEWEEEDTSHLLPVFLLQPLSQTVTPGTPVGFSALAVSVCGNGHVDCVDPEHYPDEELPKLTYQWYFNGSPIAGATTNSLVVDNVQPISLGTYTLRVSTKWHTIESQDAVLQINLTGDGAQEVFATDKLVDSEGSTLHIGVPPENPGLGARGGFAPAAASVVRGYTGTQIFNTAGTATGPGELICGVIGGSSAWITFVSEASGNLFLDTQGSSYDTVMAVFRRSPTNAAVLELVTCGNDTGTNKTSSVNLPVQTGQTNYIVVDGVNGSTGILQLNYSLVTATVLKSLGKTLQGAERVQITGRSNLNFTLQASTNMLTWTSLITTNAPSGVYEHVDLSSINSPKRYYRAVLLP